MVRRQPDQEAAAPAVDAEGWQIEERGLGVDRERLARAEGARKNAGGAQHAQRLGGGNIHVLIYPGLKALADFRLKPVLRRGGLCR